jgi:hypothetical protein
MPDSLEGRLGAMAAEPMPADLPARVRLRLARARRQERWQVAIGRSTILVLGVASGVLLWPALASLAAGWMEDAGSLAPSLMGVLNDPVGGLWAMVQANLMWGPEVLHGLGTVGLLALILMAVPALLGLNWALSGRTKEGVA